MPKSISPSELLLIASDLVLVDVRKPKARAADPLMIKGSLYRHPFEARNWACEFAGRKVAVYCVHGHEVSQAVAGFLTDEGIDCVYVEGGFAAASDEGFALTEISNEADDE